MLRSLFTAISGLTNHQTMLDVVGNNIANVNTTGYKTGRVVFEDMMSQTLAGASPDSGTQGGTNARQIGLGVHIATIDNLQTQGALQSTGVTTDLAIQGDGYFILNNNGTQVYTRDGSFTLDENGVLVSGSGLQVQGWTAVNGVLNTTGAIGSLTIPVAARMNALATTTATMTGNINSGAAVGDTYSNNFVVYDSLGATHTVTVTYTKTGADAWNWQASGTGIAAAGLVNQGALTFDVNGQLLTQTGALSITVAGGAASPLNVNPDFAQITQLNSTNTVVLNGQNGYAPGTLTSYNISDAGVINGVYDNGIVQVLGQVSLARFTNPGGLVKDGGNILTESANSGLAQVGTPGTSARGTISAGSLEMSNVNLAQEFSNMIIAERGFQANSKVITTSDEMLQELMNLKR
jgi:flagellar hook protein FlgE